MRQSSAPVLLAAAVLLLAACGSDGDGTGPAGAEPSEPAEPSAPSAAAVGAIDVNVRLVDAPPQEILFEGDGICAWDGERPVVTLRDVSGTVLGVNDLQDGGGIFEETTGCTWSVTFLDVEPGETYEATVEQDGVEHSGAGSADSGRQVVVEF